MNNVVNIQSWSQSYELVKEHVLEFTQGLENSSLSAEETDDLYNKVKQEANHLKALATAARERQEELEKHASHPTYKTIVTMGVLKTACKLCEIAGAYFSFFADNDTEEIAGLGLFMGGSLLDLACFAYEMPLNLHGVEIAELTQLDKAQAEHARQFKKFLKHFNKARMHERTLSDRPPTHTCSNTTVVLELNKTLLDLPPSDNLDEMISACLEAYEHLPPHLQKNELYYRILSMLIQHLPDDDPLKKALAELEPMPNFNGTALILPPASPSAPPQPLSKPSASTEPKGLKKEPSPPPEDGFIGSRSLSELGSDYQRRLDYCKDLINQRFRPSRDICLLYTPNGFCIDSQNGIVGQLNTESGDLYNTEAQDSISSLTAQASDPV